MSGPFDMLGGCWLKYRDGLTCSRDNIQNWPTFDPQMLGGCWVKRWDPLTRA